MTPPTMAPQWLDAVQKRLHEVEAERDRVAGEMARLEARAQLLNEERVHLRALLDLPRPAAQEQESDGPSGLPDAPLARALAESEVVDDRDATHNAPPPVDVALRANGEAAVEVALPSSSRVWKDAVRELLIGRGEPQHYRLIHQELRRLGITFGGQNPAASFLAVLNRDGDFMRVGRGIYWINGVDRSSAPASSPTQIARGRRRPRPKVRKLVAKS